QGRPLRNALGKKLEWNVRKRRSNAGLKTVSAVRTQELAARVRIPILQGLRPGRSRFRMGGSRFLRTFTGASKRERKRKKEPDPKRMQKCRTRNSKSLEYKNGKSESSTVHSCVSMISNFESCILALQLLSYHLQNQ